MRAHARYNPAPRIAEFVAWVVLAAAPLDAVESLAMLLMVDTVWARRRQAAALRQVSASNQLVIYGAYLSFEWQVRSETCRIANACKSAITGGRLSHSEWLQSVLQLPLYGV